MAEREISCCFSGHRPVRLPWGANENDPRCRELKIQIGEKLEEFHARGYRHFLCGMARGSDFYFAEAVLALREKYPDVTLEAALPCDTQPNAWSAAERRRYDHLLAESDEVTFVAHLYTPGCMQRRNEYMVDASGVLLAVFNGTAGGTMNTILYAQRKGLKVIIADI